MFKQKRKKMRSYHSERPDHVFHSYAYDEYGNYLSIFDAVKISDRKWYMDKDHQVEFLPINITEQKKQVPHWRVKHDQYIIIQGKKYKYGRDFDSESYEHKQMKGIIMSTGFFYLDNYKIFIKDSKEEYKIWDSKFKADISCTLLCGTPCIIEVVKTSDLSDAKKKYLKENEILTFKIYIDDKGNQILSKSNYFGGGKINSIKEAIQSGEGATLEIEREFKEANERSKKTVYDSVLRFSNYLDERRFRQYPVDISRRFAADILRDRKEENSRIASEIERINSEIEQHQITTERLDSIKNEIDRYERAIQETIKNCSSKWFGNRSSDLKGKDKINEIMYWIS